MAEVQPFVVAIPARYASTRLPGKPLLPIGSVPMIVRVARRAVEAGAAEVVVATDDERVAAALAAEPVRVAMTAEGHVSGSDRLAETAEICGWSDETVVVNLQGDEPFAPPAGIRAVAERLSVGDAPMATLATPITHAAELFDPNCVKVVVDPSGLALYFSRAPLPWARDAFAANRDTLPPGIPFLRHIGIYAYRAGFLRRFAGLPATPLERAENLEQLRALEHGQRIAVALTPEPFPGGVDTAADLERARALVAAGEMAGAGAVATR
jgi:3-deoxy-manno-octulosonate cytidylyltransferase (CMP-KDO synthetase)